MSEERDDAYKTAIILTVVFVIALFGAIYLDWWVTMGKVKRPVVITAPIQRESVIVSTTTDDIFMKRGDVKRWKEPEAHSCIPGADPSCGAVLTVDGEKVDYWTWEARQSEDWIITDITSEWSDGEE